MEKSNQINKTLDKFYPQDIKFMEYAIRLAEKGRGKTKPNPMVGAVIVKDGKIISTGYHKKAGSAHAEVEAIEKCRQSTSGATMYVTLEPCCIHGKTPPCTDELIKHDLKEVVIGCIDPNPMINGRGIEILKKSGIKVRVGLLQDKISVQNEVFFKHIRTKMPYLCCKIASSIDGKTATISGDSKWITSEDSRRIVQNLRKEYGAIITGINTVLLDNPLLFPRENLAITPTNILDYTLNQKNIYKDDYQNFFRIILDSNLKINYESNLVKTSPVIKTILFTSKDTKYKCPQKIKNLKQKNIDVLFADTVDTISVEHKNGSIKKLDLKKILKILYDKYAISSMLLESGPTLVTSFLKENLIDKFIIFLAPKIIGGDSRYSMFLDLKTEKIENSLNINIYEVKKVGCDIMIVAYPKGSVL